MIYKLIENVMKEKNKRNFQQHLMLIYIYINNVGRDSSNFFKFQW